MSMPFHIRFRLSTMMFLLYVIWGAWAVVAYPYFVKLKFDPWVISFLMSLMSLACIVSPFIGGQIADRWFPTQFFLAICSVAGGVLLLLMAVEHDQVKMLILMSAYSLVFAPALPLTNSLSFHHLKDPDREFSGIRVWGTIGWIAAGVTLTLWRHLCDPAFNDLMAGFSLTGDWLSRFWNVWWNATGACVAGDLFYLGGICSIAFGIFCFFLPHTPPTRQGVNPLAFLEALKLLKDRNFAVFLVIAFVVTSELNFYYIPTPSFLEDIGIAPANVPAVMSIAQIAEIVVLAFLLPLAVKKIGLKWTLALGVIAWPLRYIIFAIGQPTWLVVAALSFHGFGYAFFFVASQIYVNNVAHSDIRASAQSLLTLVTVGIGMFLGAQIFTFVKNIVSVTDAAGNVTTNWTYLFLVPCLLTAACAVAYLVFFKPPEKQLAAEGAKV
jgi:nucleoside transporter